MFNEGPNLPIAPLKHSCGRIIDRESGHPLVIVAGGYIYDSEEDTTQEIEHTYIWDTVTDVVTRVIPKDQIQHTVRLIQMK